MKRSIKISWKKTQVEIDRYCQLSRLSSQPSGIQLRGGQLRSIIYIGVEDLEGQEVSFNVEITRKHQ